METLFPIEVDMDLSKGSCLVDKSTGEEYIDFFSMYSSLVFGYNHEVFGKEFEKDVLPYTKLRFSINAFQNKFVNEYKALLSQYVFSPHIHFTCTGALAVESALKAAMDYKKVKQPIVLSIENSFHGVNSWGLTTSLVGATSKRLNNMPRLPWPSLSLDQAIEYLQQQDLTNIVAVIVEPIQCTNGDIYLDVNKLKQLHSLCRENDVCFILDEIQTGFATTGKLWYYQYLGFEPDILVFGKKSQVCGVVLSSKFSPVLSLGEKKLQVTFDGDMVDLLRSLYTLKYIVTNHVLNDVIRLENLLKEALSPLVKNYRSKGFLIAFDFQSTEQRDFFLLQCFKQNLIVNKAGEKTIRLRPNLATTEQEMSKAINIMKGLL